jgi:transposase-like protein
VEEKTQANIKTIIIQCPRCESTRIVSTHATTAADSVNYLKEYRCLNCGETFDSVVIVSASSDTKTVCSK